MSTTKLLCAFGSIIATLLIGACQSNNLATSGTTITNSKYFLLDPSKQPDSVDSMIRFEQRHHLHGAITRKQRKERQGHYYVFWWNDRQLTPVIIRLEYRQETTGVNTRVQEIAVNAPRHSNKTRFQVTGADYQTGGRVTSWRVSIIRDGTIIAHDQSYLW
jgi:hypothetical protein